jgi:hypothetical protein
MKRSCLLLLLLASTWASAQQPAFKDYFVNKALRVDLYLVGDAREEIALVDKLYQEDLWPENPDRLVEPFENGAYAVEVYDIASNRLIYKRGFSAMFGEYRTTTPAINGEKRVFDRPVRIPMPLRPVLFIIESRDKKNLLHPICTQRIDPADTGVIRETADAHDFVYQSLKNGEPQHCVDLVFVAEGYTANDQAKFKSDVDRFAAALFEVEPYKSNKQFFNISGIMRPSVESAMDEPRQGAFKKTLLNASFNTFGTDRYLLTEEDKELHEIAAQLPYDAIVILVNARRYGGGGIYNDYCMTTVDNERSKAVFVHEFGHSFAGLADEYYTSDVSYNDMYPKGTEPLEPNITALLDPAHVKWQNLLAPGIAVPTPYGKRQLDSLQALRRNLFEPKLREMDAARKKNMSEKKLQEIDDKYKEQGKKIDEELERIRKQHADVYDKVGVFEGAGYMSTGLYRPQVYCLMIYNPRNEFCQVCQAAIRQMIEYYTK